jgi:hypothetical protein
MPANNLFIALTLVAVAILMSKKLKKQREFTERYRGNSVDERLWFNQDEPYENIWEKHREEIP